MKTLHWFFAFLLFFSLSVSAHAQELDPLSVLPKAVYDLIPEKALSVIVFIHYFFSFIGTRIWKNWKAGGGFYGFKRAFFSGEKIVDAKAIDDGKDIKVAEDKRTTQAPFQPQ